MDILAALRQEEKQLQRQLSGIQNAIAALDGRTSTRGFRSKAYQPGPGRKRTLSAAARAKISQAAKARWAKVRAEKSKKAK